MQSAAGYSHKHVSTCAHGFVFSTARVGIGRLRVTHALASRMRPIYRCSRMPLGPFIADALCAAVAGIVMHCSVATPSLRCLWWFMSLCTMPSARMKWHRSCSTIAPSCGACCCRLTSSTPRGMWMHGWTTSARWRWVGLAASGVSLLCESEHVWGTYHMIASDQKQALLVGGSQVACSKRVAAVGSRLLQPMVCRGLTDCTAVLVLCRVVRAQRVVAGLQAACLPRTPGPATARCPPHPLVTPPSRGWPGLT